MDNAFLIFTETRLFTSVLFVTLHTLFWGG